MGGSIRKGRNHEQIPWQPPLDSAPPENTDDSEPALDRVPQPLGDRKPQRFRRTLKAGPFLRSAPNRTGTTHPVTHGRRTSTKNNKSVKEIGDGCHAIFAGGQRGIEEAREWCGKEVSHLRRLCFCGMPTQRLRAGLTFVAPPALGIRAGVALAGRAGRR